MSKHTPRTRCTITPYDEVECENAYHPILIPEWKSAIPYRCRSFDPDSKRWRFWGGYQDLAIELLLRYFPSAEVPTRWRDRSPAWEPPDAASEPFRVLHLRETAPVELIESAFRVLARLHHPDHGGDVRTMQAVNAAYAALKARVPA